jgi:hypothetical protein
LYVPKGLQPTPTCPKRRKTADLPLAHRAVETYSSVVTSWSIRCVRSARSWRWPTLAVVQSALSLSHAGRRSRKRSGLHSQRPPHALGSVRGRRPRPIARRTQPLGGRLGSNTIDARSCGRQNVRNAASAATLRSPSPLNSREQKQRRPTRPSVFGGFRPCLLAFAEHEPIGAAGFEPAIPAPQMRCDTRLRHAPLLPSSLLPLGAQAIHPRL